MVVYNLCLISTLTMEEMCSSDSLDNHLHSQCVLCRHCQLLNCLASVTDERTGMEHRCN